MTQTKLTDYIATDRGGVIETRHLVHAAVVDFSPQRSDTNKGNSTKLIRTAGNPHRTTLIRSAFKPVQTLSILSTGAGEKYGFSEQDVALMCASHNSHPEEHVQRAKAMLAKSGSTEEDLRCGGHDAIDPEITRGWIRTGYTPTGIDNNCSGKHAGMVAAAKALGAFGQDGKGSREYHELQHPLQQVVKRTFEEVSGLEGKEIMWTVDGCNAPAPAVRLDVLAVVYAKFAHAASENEEFLPSDAGKADGNLGDRHVMMGRVFNAMARNGGLVGGQGRFCTLLMEAFDGMLIGKVGADGCYGIGMKPCKWTKEAGCQGSLGIAIKIEDGNLDILYAAVVEVLEQLGIGTKGQRDRFARYRRPVRINTMGVNVGGTHMGFKLRPAEYPLNSA